MYVFGYHQFEPRYPMKRPFQAKQNELYGTHTDGTFPAKQVYHKTFDRVPREEKHAYGQTAAEIKVRANHGQLSYHGVPRVQSAKVLKVNAPGNTDILDLQFQSPATGLTNPADIKNRDKNTQIDIGVGAGKQHDYNSKPVDDPFRDRVHEQARAKDQMFSDIFNSKPLAEGRNVQSRARGLHRQPEDYVHENEGGEYELKGGQVKQKSHFNESYGNPLINYTKGKPTDPEYYNKVSVKAIKEAALQSRIAKHAVVEPVETKYRSFKHRAPQQDPQPKDFELKGVSENLDYVDIKKKLANSGIQVVDVNIKEDMCTQEKKGDADIKVRLNGKDDYKLKQKLSELGIEANKKEQIKKKPTHFNDDFAGDWKNEILEGKDQALMAKYSRADAKGKRQVEMSSHAQLFGTVGRK